MDDNIRLKIRKFIKDFTGMAIYGLIINCPYWMNKIKEGKVTLRGFANGKGSAGEIKEELLKRLKSLPSGSEFEITADSLRKFAKRERIGIDCSGFAYRFLDELVKLKYEGCQIEDLSEIFQGGMGRTNADTLTGDKYCIKMEAIDDYKTGDLIRINGGKHVAVIWEKRNDQLVYVHSHDNTVIKGVHEGSIKIVNKFKPLDFQKWLEKTETGENFGKKKFDSAKGDGVFRLKIFNSASSARVLQGLTLRG